MYHPPDPTGAAARVNLQDAHSSSNCAVMTGTLRMLWASGPRRGEIGSW